MSAKPRRRRSHLGEDDLIPQLLGNDERLIAQSLEKLQAIRPAGIDINMGCPVSKVLKHNWGVALMGDIGYAEKVVRETRRLTTLPLSVKMRTGLTDDPEYLVDFARMLQEAGADWITLHPRIQAHHRKGSANWSYIARVREAVRIPVVGNGDIQESDDVLRMQSGHGMRRSHDCPRLHSASMDFLASGRIVRAASAGRSRGRESPADSNRRRARILPGAESLL